VELRPGIVVSALAHGVVIAWAIFGFISVPPLDAATEPLPVEILTPSQFDHLTKGTMHGKELNSGKVEAKKVAPPTPEPKPADLPDAKADVTPPPPPPAPKQAEKPPAPPPKPKVAEAKPVPVPKPAPAPKPKPVADAAPEKKPVPEKKVDKQEMADLTKMIDSAVAKPEPKPALKKVDRHEKASLDKLIDHVADQPEPKKAVRPTPDKRVAKFDPTKIAALIDRRDPGRVAPAAAQASATSSAGIRDGLDGRLSITQRRMIDGMVREQVERCWSPPAGAMGSDDLKVRVRFSLNADGSLSGSPGVMNASAAPYFQVAAESAARAVRQCAPLRLPTQFYSYWKDVEITFDPHDMMGG
jgi:colicin import membrane protein